VKTREQRKAEHLGKIQTLGYLGFSPLRHRRVLKEKLVFDIYTAEWQYAKRQKTWFKRDDRIAWSNPSDVENIKKNVREFLKQ